MGSCLLLVPSLLCCPGGAWGRAESLSFSRLALEVGVRFVDYRFGVSLILLPKLDVYSMLSPPGGICPLSRMGTRAGRWAQGSWEREAKTPS